VNRREMWDAVVAEQRAAKHMPTQNAEAPNQRNNFVSDYTPPPVPVGQNLKTYSQAQIDAEWRGTWGPFTTALFCAALGIVIFIILAVALGLGGFL